jgi:hypothetical protein
MDEWSREDATMAAVDLRSLTDREVLLDAMAVLLENVPQDATGTIVLILLQFRR